MEKGIPDGKKFLPSGFSAGIPCLLGLVTLCFQQFFTFVLSDFFTTFFSEVSHFMFLFIKRVILGKIVLLM